MDFGKKRHEPNLLPKRIHQEQWKLERIFRIGSYPKKINNLFLRKKKINKLIMLIEFLTSLLFY